MMQKIDVEHLDHPAKGVVGMTDFLLEEGYKVGLRKVRRMMRLMGIMPVCHRNCQFTCKAWLDACAQHPQMRVSMDGRGRAKDNIWIERFWKTIKYEYIHILPE